jgi:hypothetical protein
MIGLCLTNIQVAKESVNLKHSLTLTGVFRFILDSQFVERYHSVESYGLNVECHISNNFCKFNK